MKTSTKGLKTSAKGRARGGGRGVRPGRAAGLGEQQLHTRISHAIEYAECRFQTKFPFRFHPGLGMAGVERYRTDEKTLRDDYRITRWVEMPQSWWKAVREALALGMRVSVAVPHAYAVDVAVIAARSITEIPLHALYDAVAERIVLINEDEEAICMKQGDVEQ